MIPMMVARFGLVALLLAAASTRAQERPSEQDMFGKPEGKPEKEEQTGDPSDLAPEENAQGPGAEGPRPEGPQAPPRQPAAAAEGGLKPEPGAEKRLLGQLFKTDDPLKIGGQLYLRSNLSAREHAPPSQWTLTVPSLTDVFLDVRPTNRVRGFVLGRMFFDPTLSSTATGLASGAATPNPQVLLDQLWLRFDLARTVFFSLGRQHVKWGAGHFWNPTDYLHPVKLDPLAPFDERTGIFLARLDLPWERRGWNLYAIAAFESLATQATSAFLTSVPAATGTSSTLAQPVRPSNTLGQVGGGARAELVLGRWELGADGIAQRGIRPRLGFDVSGPVGELDVRGELSLRTRSDVPLYRGTIASFETYQPGGIRPAAVGAVEWSHRYADRETNVFTVGLEYFYNSNGYGYDERGLYPVLLANGAFVSFYVGRHYAGGYFRLASPGSWNLHTFLLSAIANLSDQSAVVRFDWSMTLLTYLTVEAYVQGHLGTDGGEFRLGIDLPKNAIGVGSPAMFVGTPIADCGLNVRVAL
ncbi:MAG TPA: hypothetical protein VMK12_01415 [Anaeromyxobacteraceae bacterium]|nr:hypothetical protein [Anaeromyxobacteraceae bacterium]